MNCWVLWWCWDFVRSFGILTLEGSKFFYPSHPSLHFLQFVDIVLLTFYYLFQIPHHNQPNEILRDKPDPTLIHVTLFYYFRIFISLFIPLILGTNCSNPPKTSNRQWTSCDRSWSSKKSRSSKVKFSRQFNAKFRGNIYTVYWSD